MTDNRKFEAFLRIYTALIPSTIDVFGAFDELDLLAIKYFDQFQSALEDAGLDE